MFPEDTTALLDQVEAELNERLDSMVNTLVEAYDEGGRDLASGALALASLCMSPGELADLAIMATLRLAEQKRAGWGPPATAV